MERWRCFVAVPFPAELSARLEAAVRLWRAERAAPDVRWTDPAGWHLTLAFLGSVAAEGVPAIERAIADAARGGQREAVAGGGLGVFPAPRRARVLWYGMADPSDALGRLAGKVRHRLTPVVPRLAAESPFQAHVTLARARAERGVDLSGWLASHVAPGGMLAVDKVILYRSHLGGPGPARYETIASVPVGMGMEAPIHG